MQKLVRWGNLVPFRSNGTPALYLQIHRTKTRGTRAKALNKAIACTCTTEHKSNVCPYHAIQKWFHRLPERLRHHDAPVICHIDGSYIYRSEYNTRVRAHLNKALQYLSPSDRAAVIQRVSAKSWRSGAGTVLVQDPNTSTLAATGELDHASEAVTLRSYNNPSTADHLRMSAPLGSAINVHQDATR
eukprot:COSAG01_NODE_12700_length_1697_cov_27.883605_1_plen_187_part_00